MKERKDWNLSSCLWVRQNNNEENVVKTENYLGKFGYTDDFYPEEFKLFWKKNKNRSKSVQIQKAEASSTISIDFLSKRKFLTETMGNIQ